MASPNSIGGTAYFSIDGTPYAVKGDDISYQVSGVERTTVTTSSGNFFTEKPIAGFIKVTLLNVEGLSASNLNSMDDNTIVLQLNNGKTVVGRNMWSVENQEVNASEGSLPLKLENEVEEM